MSELGLHLSCLWNNRNGALGEAIVDVETYTQSGTPASAVLGPRVCHSSTAGCRICVEALSCEKGGPTVDC
eukprot:4606198-Amphidinium_carterae.1